MNKYFPIIINKIIKEHNIKSLLIAISGGQDSICLIKLLKYFKNYNYKKIEYIYIDHQWKNDSKKQVEHIIHYIKFLKEKINIYQIKRIGLSEKLSRIYRYHIIINHAIQHKYQAILTGHTETDKIETFFLNLLRGTTLEGIINLNVYKKINSQISIIRPLIYNDRKYLRFLCRKWFLPLWSDITNYNYTIKRNRIRNETIPYLKKYYNNKIENNLVNLLQLCYYDNEYIKQKVIKLYIYIKHPIYISLNFQYLTKQHITVQTRVLQLFFYYHFNILIHKTQFIKITKQLQENRRKMTSLYITKNINIYFIGIWIYIEIKQ